MFGKMKYKCLRILILLPCFFLASCLTPYSKPNALYAFNAVTDSPEGVIFFNKNKSNQAMLFYKTSLRTLYQAELFPKLNLNIQRCAEYYKITRCIWYADIVLDNAEAEQYGEILLNDYWDVEDQEGKFYIRSIDSAQRFKRLLNSKQSHVHFSLATAEGNSENAGKYLSGLRIKNNYIEIKPNHVQILKKPSRISRMMQIHTQ
ncbi:hypothetical protein [Acinetobacter sp.]|uniref:hypothetical protein n=1 Tax=Acinetobacter sp. TaxID=472 RepID=UPI0028B20C0D|nr:hypothetical protein [Acinetobacter sp.]